jgi:hypothetical protein
MYNFPAIANNTGKGIKKLPECLFFLPYKNAKDK